MRQWVTVETGRLCGQCGARVAAGSRMQRITLPGVQRAKFRCVECAADPLPLAPLAPPADDWERF
jgi:hypothetical protein